MNFQDRWENSPELRDAIRRRLINWGWHYRGGRPQLGYPTHCAFTTPPESSLARPAEYLGQGDADLVEWMITSAAQVSDKSRHMMEVLKTEYLFGHLAQESKAKKMKLARTTYQRHRDAADYWFFVVSQGVIGKIAA